jgi:hypothetical protein
MHHLPAMSAHTYGLVDEMSLLPLNINQNRIKFIHQINYFEFFSGNSIVNPVFGNF